MVIEDLGNSQSWTSGDIQPSNDGPIKAPAIISATTCGCTSFLATRPTKRQIARMKVNCKKKRTERSKFDMKVLRRCRHNLSKKVVVPAKLILSDNSALWTQEVFLRTGRLKGGHTLAQGKAAGAPRGTL